VHSVVVGREILWQSPIILTPYLEDGTIDAEALRRFVDEAYASAGATPDDIDSGAIILTGEALKRRNAQAIAGLFAASTGKFVCASAGHHLEAALAANGSGTVARSRRDQRTLLNVDIGGGTTKLAVVQDGEVIATAAVAIGARLIVTSPDGRLIRIDDPARLVADRLGIELNLGERLAFEDESRILEAWIAVLSGLIERRPLEDWATQLMLTEPLPPDVVPQALTLSGGVSEFIFMRETRDFGDLGQQLARAVRAALSNGTLKLPAIFDPNLGIRATAVGASLFTVQIGINHYLTDESVLPLRNLPVLVPKVPIEGDVDPVKVAASIRDALTRADLVDGEQPAALSFEWLDDVLVSRVRALAEGIRDGLKATVARRVPFVVLVDEIVADALGGVLKEELKVPGDFVCLERVAVREFDFIDVAPVVHPSEVVPVTVKSLLFAGGLDRRSVKQALLAAARSRT
jgi:ethanolamine utilization protein EutA